ncbi:MAG: glycosyltransferase [Cellulosilyticaceae bacterium]
MKILIVTSWALPCHNGGVAQVTHHLAKEFISKGHEVSIFALDYDPSKSVGQIDSFEYEGYKIRTIKSDYMHQNRLHALEENNYNQPSIEAPFCDYLEEIKPDIVQFQSIQGMGANLIKVAKQLNYKTVVTMHDWWWLCPNSFMADQNDKCCLQKNIDDSKCKKCIKDTISQLDAENFLKKRNQYLKTILEKDVDQVLVVTEYLKTYFQNNMPYIENIKVDINGVEEGIIHNQAKKNEVIKIGFLGGVQRLKGYELLQKAVPHIQSKGWELHIYSVPKVNKHGLKKAWSYLKSQGLRKLKVKLKQVLKAHSVQPSNGKIIIHPPYDTFEKETVFQEFDILLSLSIVKESSSLVVREALIRNIPVLTTDSGGPLEVVMPGINGEVVRELTPKAVAEGIDQMIQGEHYKKLRENMQKNPYTYTYENQATSLEKIYKEVNRRQSG